MEEQVPLDIERLRPRYEQLIDDVRQRAPHAKIVMVGYPEVINAHEKALNNIECSSLSLDEIAWLDSLVATINRVISEVAADKGATYVDLVPVYQAKEACGQILPEWVNSAPIEDGWCGACRIPEIRIAGSFHPNEHGHAAAGVAVANGLSR